MADYGLLAGIGEGIQKGMSGYWEGRKIKKSEDLDAEKMAILRREEKLKNLETGAKLAESGILTPDLAAELGMPQGESGLLGVKTKKRREAEKQLPGLVIQGIDKDLEPTIDENDNIVWGPLSGKTPAGARRVQKENLEIEGKQQDLLDKHEARTTPFGEARTPDDAKQLKSASELKSEFDAKVDEMVALRKKYGGELWNREAVERGKQLSKDLLLAYKDMSKLGVLSKSDENILNAIIPEDPLEFKASGLVGQDPIMHRLKKFKQDSDRDFKTRLGTRLKGGGLLGAQAASSPRPSAPSSGLFPEARAATTSNAGRVIVSNGKETLTIDPKDLDDAKRDGFRPLSGGQ